MGQLATCILELSIQRDMAGLPDSGRTTLVQKNAKITMWVYFGLTADENGVPVPNEEYMLVCRMCKKAVMCRGGSTTNLFAHLQDTHPKHHREAIQGKTDTSKGKSPRQLSLDSLASPKREGSTPKERTSEGAQSRGRVLYCKKNMQPTDCALLFDIHVVYT